MNEDRTVPGTRGVVAPLPVVGAIVRDTGHPGDTEDAPRLGVVMAYEHAVVWLRPVSGGREWTARPGALVPACGEALRPAVREANRYGRQSR